MLLDGVLDFITGFFSSILSLFNFVVPGFQSMTALDILLGIFAFGVACMVFKTLFHEFANNISIGSLRGENRNAKIDSKRVNDER